ncbi:DUF397 domain-containing protein [Streptomyces griseorubiginosus]|uniref:DUF397 domain-containing protein n=1 Tax=Streptomyces griseorubiginosus TaxID=67304 RepID=UPI0036E4A406
MIHDTDSELQWFKSSYSSGSEGDSCVEIAATPGTVHVRDSKFRDASPRFSLTSEAWARFLPFASED